MLARPAKRLTEAHAHRVVAHCVDCLQRAGVDAPEFAASYPTEGFTRVYDTLVLQLDPVQPCLVREQASSGPAQSPAELIREALLLLHALSHCPGYSFHDNFGFWSVSLASRTLASREIPVSTGTRFPRVVLDWNPRFGTETPRKFDHAAGLLMFKTSVIALFTTPSDRRISIDGKKLMSGIPDFRVSSLQGTSPIECVVSIRFAQVTKDTEALVETVIASAKQLMTSSPIQKEFVWHGVSIAASSHVTSGHRSFISRTNLRLMHRLCTSLPAPIAIDIAPPRGIPTVPLKEVAKAPCVSFLTAAIGFVGTEQLGRLAVLDLRSHYNITQPSSTVDFASLCTLLPFSRSLQTLRVTVRSRIDLLWLVYAATHPLAPTTQWRALHLHCLGSRNTKPSRTSDSSLYDKLWSHTTQVDSTGRLARDHVRRTAKVAHDVRLFTTGKITRCVQLVDNFDLELCDTTTSLDELVLESGDPNLDSVEVVVAGVGLCWVHKRDLTQLADTRYQGPRRSYLTTIALDSNVLVASEAASVLRFLGPELVHLGTADPLVARQAARVCPRLAAIDLGIVGDLPVMPSLQSVSLVCDGYSIGASFGWLESLPMLRTVRVRFQGAYFHPTWWTEIDTHLATLVETRGRKLRSVTVIHSGPENALSFGRDGRLSCDATSKRAFLSVLRRGRDSGSALSPLDADIARQVFGFAGYSFRRHVLHGSAGWVSDWYDSLRS